MTKLLIDEAVARIAKELLESAHVATNVVWVRNDCVEALGQALEQPAPAQEPVAWIITSEMQDGTRQTYPVMGRFKDVQDCCDFGEPIPLYTTPPAPEQKSIVAEYWAIVDWHGKHIQVDQNTMQLEVYETEQHAKANVQPRTKATLVYISATPSAPAQKGNENDK